MWVTTIIRCRGQEGRNRSDYRYFTMHLSSIHTTSQGVCDSQNQVQGTGGEREVEHQVLYNKYIFYVYNFVCENQVQEKRRRFGSRYSTL